MYKYNYCFKFFAFMYNNLNVIIGIDVDNTLSKKSYGASSNLLFQDENGDWGHAAGIGGTESDALNMCLDELMFYMQIKDITKEELLLKLTEISLPRKLTIEINKDHYTTILIKKEYDKDVILTDKKLLLCDKKVDLKDFIKLNMKDIKNSEWKNFSYEYLKTNNFFPSFEQTFEHYYH